LSWNRGNGRSCLALHHGSPVGESGPQPVSIVGGETTSIDISLDLDFHEVILQSVTANGAAGTATTTRLFLIFDRDIDLRADDLVLSGSGVTKGGLTKVPNTTRQCELAVTGTSVMLSTIVDEGSMLMVILGNAGQAAYENLYTQIQRISGETGTRTSIPGYDMGEFEYAGFTLTVIWTADSGQISLTVLEWNKEDDELYMLITKS
jgi:hypothetical protein